MSAVQGVSGQPLLQGIVWTPSMRRMYSLLSRCAPDFSRSVEAQEDLHSIFPASRSLRL